MERVAQVLKASPDAALVVDEEGVIRRANETVEDVLGYDPVEIRGLSVEDLLRPEDRESHVAHRREYMRDPEPRPMGETLDLYALRKDGTTVPVEISLAPIDGSDGLLVVATVTDITARLERERRLQRQNDRLERFGSIVSHDLRNPLNVAIGHAGLLRAEGVESDHLDTIERSLDRMEAIVEDVLTLARDGEMVDEVETVPLADLAEQCWANVETAGADLTVEADVTIEADPDRLRHVLENLFRNSVEHRTSGEESVTVRVGPLPGDRGFYVEDDGPGIPVEERERVFEWGYSGSATGTGFGLAIVRELAEAHGWQVTLDDRVDGGVRFEFRPEAE